ncbi:ABC transporter substrate-binding protein [Desulfococcaceae bacterium HSG9]|nr:ABC transporter substrate-binding protein [Desulfococcaceae bacterium HSG9]
MLKKMIVSGMFIVMLCSQPGFAKEPLQPLTIRLNWIANVEFAGVLLAKKRGWYEKAGIDLTIKAWETDKSPIEEVIAGKAQIGVAEGADLIKAQAEGKKIKAIAAKFQKTPYCLVSKKKQGIKTLKQLKGKKVGIYDPSAILMLKIVLADAGMKYDDIIPVEIGWDVQALLDDKIDVHPGFMNDEPRIIKEKGFEANVIPAFKHGYDFYAGVYFVADTIIQKQPKLIQTFLNVTLRGWREAFKNPEETAKMIVTEYHTEGSVKQQTESLKIFHTLAMVGTAGGDNMIGIMEGRFWARGVDILYKYKQIDKKIPATDLFTLEFLKKVTTTR